MRPKAGAGPQGAQLGWGAWRLPAHPLQPDPGPSLWLPDGTVALAATAPTSTLRFPSWLHARLRPLELLGHLESAVSNWEKTLHKLGTPGHLCVEAGGGHFVSRLCGASPRLH